jgi:hypothetical protein
MANVLFYKQCLTSKYSKGHIKDSLTELFYSNGKAVDWDSYQLDSAIQTLVCIIAPNSETEDIFSLKLEQLLSLSRREISAYLANIDARIRAYFQAIEAKNLLFLLKFLEDEVDLVWSFNDSINRENILQHAIKENWLELIILLCKSPKVASLDFKFNEIYSDGNTCLHIVAANLQLDILLIILSSPVMADINLKNRKGRNFLHSLFAALYKRWRMGSSIQEHFIFKTLDVLTFTSIKLRSCDEILNYFQEYDDMGFSCFDFAILMKSTALIVKLLGYIDINSNDIQWSRYFRSAIILNDCSMILCLSRSIFESNVEN